MNKQFLATSDSIPPVIRSYWVIEGKFLAGAYPGSHNPDEHRDRIKGLWDAGMRTFVNLMEEEETDNNQRPFAPYVGALADFASQSGEEVMPQRFAVRDLGVPTVEGMHAILHAIDHSLATERPVYLHCFGGVGRTGVTVCCWLLKHGLAQPHELIQVLTALRQADRTRSNRLAPENDSQIEFVRNCPGPSP
jgi:hypothetical protein